MGFFKDITNHHHNPKGRYNTSIVVVTQRYPPPSALRVPQELENCFVANERQTKVVVMNPSNYHLIVRRGQLAFYDSIRAHILSLKIITLLLKQEHLKWNIFNKTSIVAEIAYLRIVRWQMVTLKFCQFFVVSLLIINQIVSILLDEIACVACWNGFFSTLQDKCFLKLENFKGFFWKFLWNVVKKEI